MSKETRNIILHLLGSIAFLSIPIVSSPDFNTNENLFSIIPFLQDFTRYVLLLIFFYLNYYFSLPKLFFSSKKLVFLILVIVCFLIVYALPSTIFPYDFHPKTTLESKPHFPKNNFFHLFEGVFPFLFVFGLSYLMKINNRFEEMKSEKQAAEISYLKAQINPHFLFNTLNSLYALTITKSDDAPDALLKLSNMMRYVVTESSQEFVPLEKEINYIKDYIDLQKLRMDENVNFSFLIEGLPYGKAIAPMLLIPFVENAFKYGLNPEEDSTINLRIQITKKSIVLDAKNKMVVEEIPEELKTEKGIENTKKRLDFIYPNKYKLTFNENQNTYHIHLEIELT